MKNITLILMLFAFSTGCHHHEHAHEEHEHDVTLQLTAYSNDMEMYADADPFAAGKSSTILAHFTWLENFKPLEAGAVTADLIVGSKSISQTLDKPTKTGIYVFTLKPTAQGKGQLRFRVVTEKGESLIIVDGIRVFADKHDAEHDAEAKEKTAVNSVSFTKEQAWKIDFKVDFPKKEPFGQIIRTTAQIQSSHDDEIIVSAKTNGIVRLNGNSILEGKDISTGQLLFSVSGSGFSDNNIAVRFAEAKNNFEKAKSDFERAEELAKEKIVSEKDLLIAKNEFENAKALYDNLAKNFNSGGQNVSSPMAGYIKHIYAGNGSFVEAGQPILVISQNKKLILSAEVQQKFAPVLGSVVSANLRTLYDNKSYTLEELNGSFLSFGKSMSSDNFLLPVKMQIENNGHFIPGGFVEVLLKTTSNTEALTVPKAALLEEQGIFFVFVEITPELFEKREVKPGATDGMKFEILRGISSNERIVTEGAIFIKLAQATGGLDAHAGHNH
ncbi:MAG: efflux RND transporter periplasmic adaptor subunit [Bacteroidetes bacterium]|nr:efflux RND transporter periplasmic adaptor subunit [Bacteroidota bacterium]